MLNLEYLKEITGNDIPELNYLIEQFISTTKEDINNLIVAIQNNNTTEIKSISHRIKGSSAIAGAYKLKKLATELEYGEEISRDHYKAILIKIQNCFQSIVSEISEPNALCSSIVVTSSDFSNLKMGRSESD
ncbi:MAG: Hpt domain-containing protein [Candidatus Endonucleobacter bathymodioli]|uniref:Hpt domain-containing protein n=1 Tax=Candidatus Endonucleibacter bathymodioli TaxID=539814 RepID=A0AA90NSZ5_9GAMM|nr:Hpt domain-containing protein [Candidatus Endonucleobacter bathymodioli]